MKVISINLNKERQEVLPNITIIPISDAHIGDKLSNLKKLKEVLSRIKEETNTYTILNGDLVNVALKNSKSDVYNEEMTPMEQILELSELLKPIRNKILVFGGNGNHEDRITKETSIDIGRVVARELGIEDRYASGMWYLFLSLGEYKKNRPIKYQITGYHGNVGGRKPGAKINRLEEMSSISIADLYIMSHSHKPIITKNIIYIPEIINKNLNKKELYFLMTNSFLEYEDGYAEKMGLLPSNTGITEAQLCGYTKKIKLSM